MWTWVGVVCLVMAYSCTHADSGRHQVPIMEVSASGVELRLSVGACNDDAEVATAGETADRVTISVMSSKDYKGDCADGASVTLKKPIGNRRVVDAFDGSILTCRDSTCRRKL